MGLAQAFWVPQVLQQYLMLLLKQQLLFVRVVNVLQWVLMPYHLI